MWTYTPKSGAAGVRSSDAAVDGPERTMNSEANAELVEATAHRLSRGLEQAGDGPQVLRPNGEHAAIEVLPLHLDHAEIPAQEVALGGRQFLQPSEIDGDPVVTVLGRPSADLAVVSPQIDVVTAPPRRLGAEVSGQQLID